jgi:DNA-binding HxlR family transcriptional regulator
MPTPRPGQPVRGSTTGRPLMAALDLLGRRWSLRLIWELRDGPVGARALLARCPGLSSSVLYQRLGELGASGLTAATDAGYELTPAGRGLGAALGPLDAWANAWADSMDRQPSSARSSSGPASSSAPSSARAVR